MKKVLYFSCLTAIFTACGGDSNTSKPNDSYAAEADLEVETFEDLPVCSQKKAGVTAYVSDEKLTYICEDGDWAKEKTDEDSDSRPKSSSSSKTQDKSCSSSKYDLDVETFEDLPVCSQKKAGVTAYVSDEKNTYVCEDGDWSKEKTDKDSDSKTKSSSSSEKQEKSSSSSKYDLEVETFEELTVCSEKKAGTTAYVSDEKLTYICKDEKWIDSEEKEKSSSSVAEQDSTLQDSVPVVEIKDKILTGLAQGPFVTGSSVDLYELDSTFKPTGKSFTGKISSNDGAFKIAGVTLASPYAIIKVNGHYTNITTGERSGESISMNAIVDLTNREKVNVNLLTHLEFDRVMYLLDSGEDFASAKKQAEKEVLEAFFIQDSLHFPEEINFFNDDSGAAIFAINVLMIDGQNDGEYVERLSNFIADVEKDGKWDDEITKRKLASRADDHLTKRDDIVNRLSFNIPDFEKYTRDYWQNVLVSGDCNSTRNGELVVVDSFTAMKWSQSFGYVEFMTSVKFYCYSGKWYDLRQYSKDLPKEIWLNPEIQYDSITDSRDGNKYKTVKIDTQIWMAENLNYSDSVKTLSLKNENLRSFDEGITYTWSAAIDSVKNNCASGTECSVATPAQGICPEGWHLPSRKEFETLIITVGGTLSWKSYEEEYWVDQRVLLSQNGHGVHTKDLFGFSALATRSGCFWSSEGRNSMQKIDYNLVTNYFVVRPGGSLFIGESSKEYCDIRCIKD